MRKEPSILYVVIAAVALSLGLLVYLLDRQPEHTYFLSHGLTLAHAPHAWFGVVGNHLPAFLHVYAFVLLTVAAAGSANARLIRIGAAWFVITALFEFGQHPAAAPLIAASLPAWFAQLPVLDNTAAYFLKGTFDPLDFLAMILGTVAGGLTVGLTRNSVNTPPPAEPRPRVWRRLAVGGAIFAGMLGIVGSGGGGEGDVNFGSGDDSLIYVSGNASDALLVYESANSVSGNTSASRTVEGVTNTTLDEPRGIAVDMARNRIYVANAIDNTILVFNNARTMTGDIAPARTISGGSLDGPAGLFLDIVNDRLYVTNKDSNSVLIYDNASSRNGNTVPDRVLSGGSTSLSAPTGIFVDTVRDLLYVADDDGVILVFEDASTIAGGITGPIRTISILSSIAGVFVDVMADRLYVSNTGANSIFIFDDASRANGAAPHRVISASLDEPRDIFVDAGTDRLYVVNAVDDTILVFNNASTTDNPLAPARALNLPANTDPWGVYVDVTPVVIGSTASLDGFIRYDGSAYAATSNGGSPRTGDDEEFLAGSSARQFFSFNLSNLTTSITVKSAILRLYQVSQTPQAGTPFNDLGNVVVDHVDYENSLDSSLGDYDGVPLALLGTFSTSVTAGYRTLVVTTQVDSDIAMRGYSQYRLRFSPLEINNDFDSDYVQFTDAEDSCCAANRPPQLVITIEP